jgi:hypothetical protein
MNGRDALAAALAEHRAAVETYLRRAAEVSSERWSCAVAPGKWSPEEITEHLRLALDRLDRELRGETAMRCRLPAWKRFLLRRRALPGILRTGRFPRGVPAPREIRPSAPGTPQGEALRGLAAAAEGFAAACRAESSPARRRLTHPYFGSLALPQFHRLLALHTLHHRDQLPPGTEKN